jgi:hypothetical protein
MFTAPNASSLSAFLQKPLTEKKGFLSINGAFESGCMEEGKIGWKKNERKKKKRKPFYYICTAG